MAIVCYIFVFLFWRQKNSGCQFERNQIETVLMSICLFNHSAIQNTPFFEFHNYLNWFDFIFNLIFFSLWKLKFSLYLQFSPTKHPLTVCFFLEKNFDYERFKCTWCDQKLENQCLFYCHPTKIYQIQAQNRRYYCFFLIVYKAKYSIQWQRNKNRRFLFLLPLCLW